MERIPTDGLAELIAAKRDILEQVRQLSRQQSADVASGELTRLLTILAAKESLLRRLFAVERKLDPYREEDPEARRWRSPEARRRCQQDAERCESLLSEIMLLEKQSESDLRSRRDETAQQLEGLQSAGEARRAYAFPMVPQPSHLDLSSEG